MSIGHGKQQILIVDDESINIKQLSNMLRAEYDVKLARNGEAALALVEKHDIDLILLDIVMEGLSGFDVLAKLKGNPRTEKIPVIFVTGMESQDDEIRGLELGAVDYIRKPFAERIVHLRVNTHLTLINQMKLIENLSLTDALTGLSNRRSFDSCISLEWNKAIRAGNYIGFMMVDIDKFKTFNDTYGHAVGDVCLKVVAKTLKESLRRTTDYVFRWGGEEFAILLLCTDLSGTLTVAEGVRRNVEAAVVPVGSGKSTKVTVSLGAGSTVPTIGASLAEFIKCADAALYRAKQKGRNCVEQIIT